MIFVASVAGLRGAPFAAPYAASKHGLIGLMRSLAAEFAKSPMTVNAVCPSFVDTPMVDDSAARIASVSKRSEAEAREALAAMNRHGRLVVSSQTRPPPEADHWDHGFGPALRRGGRHAGA